MSQDYECGMINYGGFGGGEPRPQSEVRGDFTDKLSEEKAHEECVSNIEEILRSLADRMLWEVIWRVIDPDGELIKQALTSIIVNCRDAMRYAASEGLVSENEEHKNFVLDTLDKDIEEAASLFLEAYMNKKNRLMSDDFIKDVADKLRKNLNNGKQAST